MNVEKLKQTLMKFEDIKQYELEYSEILMDMDVPASKRTINKMIARKWSVPYQVIKRISEEAEIIRRKNASS